MHETITSGLARVGTIRLPFFTSLDAPLPSSGLTEGLIWHNVVTGEFLAFETSSIFPSCMCYHFGVDHLIFIVIFLLLNGSLMQKSKH